MQRKSQQVILQPARQATFKMATPNNVESLDHTKQLELKITDLSAVNLKGDDKDMFLPFYSAPAGVIQRK